MNTFGMKIKRTRNEECMHGQGACSTCTKFKCTKILLSGFALTIRKFSPTKLACYTVICIFFHCQSIFLWKSKKRNFLLIFLLMLLPCSKWCISHLVYHTCILFIQCKTTFAGKLKNENIFKRNIMTNIFVKEKMRITVYSSLKPFRCIKV